ncbi:MAG: tRNA 2-thiouridine(34) synthase MnmA [Phycisphaeraceae bacterium]|nr:tRNA 2-thiouridine(34) synthase MnmA [Phycisphaeraceae bacterium]
MPTDPDHPGKVLVAMSGGVDSSVAAALLVEQGYDVVGCFMRLGEEHEPEGMTEGGGACDSGKRRAHRQGCCSVGDAADARLVAAELDIPFYVCNFRKDFGRIQDYFVHEYLAGRTPNPCVRCNDWLKLGKMHDYARQIGADAVATGHYARIGEHDGSPALLRGIDGGKDQSYVLFGTPAEKLAVTRLPIGEFEKPAIREMAKVRGLPVFNKPDSQEICFIPDNDYAGYVERRAPEAAQAGAILTTEGVEIGAHRGQHRFTIGQRRGLGVASTDPIYVIGRDPATNTVTVGSRDDLRAPGLLATELNWLVGVGDLASWRPVAAQIRYNSDAVPALARIDADTDTLEIRFDESQIAVAPGQAVVCYDAETNQRVLGGGWIRSSLDD